MAYLQFRDAIWKLANFSEEKLNRWQSKEKAGDRIFFSFASEMLISTVMNEDLQKYFADKKTNVARGSYRTVQDEKRKQSRTSWFDVHQHSMETIRRKKKIARLCTWMQECNRMPEVFRNNNWTIIVTEVCQWNIRKPAVFTYGQRVKTYCWFAETVAGRNQNYVQKVNSVLCVVIHYLK